ncbi:MAG: hypothetical protein ACFFCM_18975 [Promethearchaeota archaeon]
MNDQQLKQIYNNFEVKDMTFADFKKEINSLSDPVKMQQDLSNIQLLKARGRLNKERIDRNLRRR